MEKATTKGEAVNLDWLRPGDAPLLGDWPSSATIDTWNTNADLNGHGRIGL
jgi:hypothetical protein